MTTILWFQRDLRLDDNPALAAAVARGGPMLPVFIRDDADAGPAAPGAASRWWLHGSLEALGRDLEAKGSRLVLRTGPAEEVVARLVDEVGASAVIWTRRHEPWALRREARLEGRLRPHGVATRAMAGGLLHDPAGLRTQSGAPYRVFTPFWRALRERVEVPPPSQAPAVLPPAPEAASEALADWRLRPRRPDWAGGLRAAWRPGEAGAQARLGSFLETSLSRYREGRNVPALDATSRLSPHLHFGEIGPRQIWRAALAASAAREGEPWSAGCESFLSEIAWREFSAHLLHHAPDLPDAPMKPQFARLPWREDAMGLEAWRRGRTGYPIVDAGLRQLWATGWMHNRVRMIAASFLVKDLLIDWRVGEAWFWDTLVDADLASNAASWQWVAGCGADAAPYFRILNPVLQGETFDPDGAYVRRWVPELARMPAKLIHAPWKARPIELAAAGVSLGVDYPQPILDHGRARERALRALKAVEAAAG